MAVKDETTPSSMSYLSSPSDKEEPTNMSAPETPHSVRVTKSGAPTATAPFGTWSYPAYGQDPSDAPAYAPYGEPWPATFDTRVTDTIYVTVHPIPRGKSWSFHKNMEEEARRNPAHMTIVKDLMPAERPGEVEAHDDEAGSVSSIESQSTELPGLQRGDDTQCELRSHRLSSSSDITIKPRQRTKRVFRSERKGGIRMSWSAVLDGKTETHHKRESPDENEIGEVVPAQKLRRKKATWDLRADIRGPGGEK